MPDVRIEKDSLGEMKVPAEALWGPQTQRAVENFPISGRPLPPAFIHTLGLLNASAGTFISPRLSFSMRTSGMADPF